MGQMHRFLFSFQLEAWEKWKYGLGNTETEGDCSLFSETLAYLPRHLNLAFKKNYLPSMFTSSEGERWFSTWERTQLSLSYLPDHMWTLPWTQSEYITSFTSCLCNHFVQMVFSLLFCFPWFHRSFKMELQHHFLRDTSLYGAACPLPQDAGWDSISSLCFLLAYKHPMIDRVAMSYFLGPALASMCCLGGNY